MAKKMTRLQQDEAGLLPTFQPGEEVTVGGRSMTFLSYENRFGPLYATVTHPFTGNRNVQRHLIRPATVIGRDAR